MRIRREVAETERVLKAASWDVERFAAMCEGAMREALVSSVPSRRVKRRRKPRARFEAEYARVVEAVGKDGMVQVSGRVPALLAGEVLRMSYVFGSTHGVMLSVLLLNGLRRVAENAKKGEPFDVPVRGALEDGKAAVSLGQEVLTGVEEGLRKVSEAESKPLPGPIFSAFPVYKETGA